MSSLKSNNRFSFLDETQNEAVYKKKNQNISFKERDNNSKSNYYKFNNETKSVNSKKDFEMKANEFPELTSLSNKEKEKMPISWSSYKFNDQKKDIFVDTKSKKIECLVDDKLNEAEEIIEALSFLHEKRTEEYIKLWGEEEWERMFISPNYDYEYFDKLDEAYEIEQAKINEQYSNYAYDSGNYDDDYKSS